MSFTPGVKTKLFLAFLLTSTALIVLMVAAVHWSFHRGFLGYVNEMEMARVAEIGDTLERYYAAQGAWEGLRANPRQWFRLLRPENGHGWPAAEEMRPPGRLPSPEMRAAGSLLHTVPRLTLLDAARQVVVGNPNVGRETVLRPLRHQGQTVGWLGILPIKALREAADVRFQAQQARAFYVIAALAVLLALIAAVLLARQLLRPVQVLTDGTRRLTAGDFTTRVRVPERDEFGRLAQDFNLLAETLERNDQARRRWMADISHELRTPLAVLRGEIEALEDGVRPLDATALASLRGEVAHLAKLVDDLYQLSMSDLGALNYHKQALPLLAPLQAALGHCTERLAQAGITLETAFDCEALQVFGDADRLRQLFDNLLENTLRYTDRGGTLRVACAREGAAVIIDFQDSAPGVPDTALPRLFERLYRVEGSRSRARGGAGLGLAIARNIVEAHGGTLTAQHAPQGGLWLRIRLPLPA